MRAHFMTVCVQGAGPDCEPGEDAEKWNGL